MVVPVVLIELLQPGNISYFGRVRSSIGLQVPQFIDTWYYNTWLVTEWPTAATVQCGLKICFISHREAMCGLQLLQFIVQCC